MASLNDVINGVMNGKSYRRREEDGGFQQLVPLLPRAMCEVRYTVVDSQGEFAEWSIIALDILLDPHSRMRPEGWEELNPQDLHAV